jgi:hypothetical protein
MNISESVIWTDHTVVRRIMQEDGALRDKLRHIHNAIVDVKPSAEEVEHLLRDFKRLLEFHFIHEEKEGFFQEVTNKAPRLAERAKILCEEHRKMLADSGELCRFAAAGSPSVPWWHELRGRCQEFSNRLKQHENEECALLQETHQTDLGRGD